MPSATKVEDMSCEKANIVLWQGKVAIGLLILVGRLLDSHSIFMQLMKALLDILSLRFLSFNSSFSQAKSMIWA